MPPAILPLVTTNPEGTYWEGIPRGERGQFATGVVTRFPDLPWGARMGAFSAVVSREPFEKGGQWRVTLAFEADGRQAEVDWNLSEGEVGLFEVKGGVWGLRQEWPPADPAAKKEIFKRGRQVALNFMGGDPGSLDLSGCKLPPEKCVGIKNLFERYGEQNDRLIKGETTLKGIKELHLVAGVAIAVN